MIIATGPESSGTHLLANIMRNALHRDVQHLSMPEANRWWDWREVAAECEKRSGEPTLFVVSLRRPDIAGMSAVKRGFVRSIEEHRVEWARAVGMLALIPDAYWISYDALLLDPMGQVEFLADWLGVRWPYPPKDWPNPIDALNEQYREHPDIIVTDENHKWLRELAGPSPVPSFRKPKQRPEPPEFQADNAEWLREFVAGPQKKTWRDALRRTS